jgi:uncharacterized membrane protein YgdD (TMEM256/DUF423 family)
VTENNKRELIIASVFFMLAVALGAFGAHGLKPILTEKAMQTYQTGVQYQFLHAIALFIVSFIGHLYQMRIQLTFWIFTAGIIFFSFNCYLYAFTGVKAFAMIVPVGGLLFLIGWSTLVGKIVKK